MDKARFHQLPTNSVSNSDEKSFQQSYLGEVKRFITYYSTCLYYQKQISEESKQMKERLNSIYQELLLVRTSKSHNPFLNQLIIALLDNIKDNTQLGSIWKASIKTMIKLLQYNQVVEQLKQTSDFDPEALAQTFLEAKFEHVDINEEEQKLLLIQKSLLKIVKTFTLSEDYQFKICKYFMTILKKKAVEECDTYTLHFSDATKKSLHQLLYYIMAESEEHDEMKKRILGQIITKIQKTVPQLTDKKYSKEIKLKEYVCFLVKTIEDSLKKIQTTPELINLILSIKAQLIEVICLSAEYEDVMIRTQAQQVFTFLLLFILENNIPMREELEVLLVKVALKPVLLLAKKLGQSDILAKSTAPTSSSASSEGGKSAEAALGSQHTLTELDYEHEDFIQVSHERTQQEEILMEMNMNYLIETLLLLSPEQIAKLFLMYDCQPFSENLITKSIIIILKYSQNNPQQYFGIFRLFIERFSSFGDFKALKNSNSGGPQMISYMLEQKAQYRKLVKDLNAKYKVFLQKIDDMYSYVDQNTPSEVASKILVYSREVLIDKIAEVIGGKDDRAKRLLNAYLNKMDYSQNDIEKSLRKFLQTYRLAGVDSQVILRILELFSHKFFDNDKKNTFANKEEAYEFAYLIIVLQTCQHNPSVKNKTDLNSFIESAYNICPKSKETFPEGFFEGIFNSVTNNKIFTPNSRSLIEENFNPYTLNEIEIRLSHIEADQRSDTITESEFINSSDLTQKQLFHYSNSIEVPSTLVALSSKHLLQFLTHRFLKYVLVLHGGSQDLTNKDQQQTKFNLLVSLIDLNKHFQNVDLVDKMFQVIYKVVISGSNADEEMHSQLEGMLWDNFEWIKRSLILLPKLSIQSFMKDEIKNSIKDALNGVQRCIILRQQEKNKHQLSKKELKDTNKQPSFFDLVYNYFTEANEEDQNIKKEDLKELETFGEIKKKTLFEDKEGDYMENIEEKFDDKIGQQWMKEKTRIHELITLVCSQIKENFNQEEGLQCLAFLEHVINKSDHSPEVMEKLWVEMHILMNYCLKTKTMESSGSSNNLLLQSGISKDDSTGKAEYEVVSTDTSQDSIEHTHQELDLFSKEACQIKTKIYETSNRHLILSLHLSLSKHIILIKQDSSHVIRDIQRLVSTVIEDPSDKNHDNYKLFDDNFLFKQLSLLLKGDSSTVLPIKSYPKISKLLRLLLILILKSQTRKLEGDDISTELLLHQFSFFKLITQYISEMANHLPNDLISLSLDVFSKIQIPTQKQVHVEQIFENAIQVLDNLMSALSKQTLINDESKQELWFKIVQIMQEKILFNPACKKCETATIQIFNAIKNAALSHPFEISQENFKQIRRLFTDILFWQTFENLNSTANPYVKEGSGNSKLTEESKTQKKNAGSNTLVTETVAKSDNDSDDDESFESQLEQMCSIGVNNLSDIFIYYIAIIFKDGEQIEEQKQEESKQVNQTDDSPSNEQDTNQQIFTYLWLNLLKVLLHYAEQANQRDFHSLVLCVHDNVKRVIEFLIQQKILVEGSQNTEMQKLWKTSWDIIGAFFTEMKQNVYNSNYKAK